MSGTPLFLITDLGLAVASTAGAQGPYIHIATFQIGSGYGYDPQRSDPGINGNLLYSGVPTTYSNIGNNTIDIQLEIPPDAGPFDFGEVAVFLDDGTMFAKAVFDTPQTKYSSLGTNVISSYTFHALLKLQQSTAVFQVDTLNGPPAVWEVYNWSDVYPPSLSANPDIPLILVRELNSHGDSSLLTNTSDSAWSLESTGYMEYASATGAAFTVANSTTTWVEFAAGLFRPSDLTAVNRRFVIETSDKFFRSVSQVVVSGGNYRFYLNANPLLSAPGIGSQMRIYRDDQRGGTIYYGQIVDPPAIPAQYVLPKATTGSLGGVIVGDYLSVDGNGRISALPPYSPPPPYTLPIANGGTLGGVKIGSGINEAGDGTISVTIPTPLPYTPAGGGVLTSFVWGGGTFTYNATRNGMFMAWIVDDQSRNTTLQLNTFIVSKNTKDGGGGYGRRHHDICAFRAGDTIQYTTSGGAGNVTIWGYDQ